MKTKPTLLNWSFIEELAVRMTKGAETHPDKPGRPFYLDLPEKDLEDKLLRHALAYASGEKIDPGTNQSHLVAIACNAMMTWAKQASVRESFESDNRPMSAEEYVNFLTLGRLTK